MEDTETKDEELASDFLELDLNSPGIHQASAEHKTRSRLEAHTGNDFLGDITKSKPSWDEVGGARPKKSTCLQTMRKSPSRSANKDQECATVDTTYADTRHIRDYAKGGAGRHRGRGNNPMNGRRIAPRDEHSANKSENDLNHERNPNAANDFDFQTGAGRAKRGRGYINMRQIEKNRESSRRSGINSATYGESAIQVTRGYAGHQQPYRKKNAFLTMAWLLRLREERPISMSKSLQSRVGDLEYSLKQTQKSETSEFYPWITELIHILASVSGANTIGLPTILGCLQRSSFFDSILSPYITLLEVDKRKASLTVVGEMESVTTLLQSVIRHTPRSIISIIGIETIARGVLRRPDVEQLLHQRKDIEERLDQIRVDVKEVITRRSNQWVGQNENHSSEEVPPNNFRQIDVYPSSEELLSGKKPFLRKNVVDGSYDNAEHYLDVQYRLLREDFIQPLREGITCVKNHLEGNIKQTDIQNVKIYKNVSVLHPVFTDEGLGYRLYLPSLKFRSLEACNRSKKLIYGSLLCLSSDNFKTLVFATVANRDATRLMRSELEVSIIGPTSDERLSSGLKDKQYFMVESEAFFEAYKHVLYALKMFRRIPFSRYILQCEKDVDPPTYLEPGTEYDFTQVIGEAVVITEDFECKADCYRSGGRANPMRAFDVRNRRASPLSVGTWPTANDLGLDQSQYTALMTALTTEFVVTQGPPGTGKTYIGLQIAKVLLSYQGTITDKTPILVVCYTNHALDQFLEGISKFFLGSIIRSGGRSSNEALSQYSLSVVRQKMREDKRIPYDIYDNRRVAKLMMDKLKDRITRLIGSIAGPTYDISQYMTGQQLESLQNGFLRVLLYTQDDDDVSVQSMFHVWLGLLQIEGAENDAMDSLPHVECHTAHGIELTIFPEDTHLIAVKDTVQTLTADRMSDDIDLELAAPTGPTAEEGEKRRTKEKKGNKPNGSDGNEWVKVEGKRRNPDRDTKRYLSTIEPMSEGEARQVMDVWTLSNDDRWRIFQYWQYERSRYAERRLIAIEQDYKLALTEYQRARRMEDTYIIRNSAVVGMTTTGAARCQKLLFDIGPKIVIVEEAAEVLETHIIATLSPRCEHLILIGDHEQLRPNPTTYELAHHYRLDVSLFERMIRNGMPSNCLELQHRMRPEISKVMRHIYPNLQDHESVTKYDRIKGVSKSFFFISHSELESKNKDKDSEEKSHWNEHEGMYAVALCKYLIQQGYSGDKITVLTTYAAQMFFLRNHMPKNEFEGVQLTVVDNYQGEENDIIILSLVRSNNQGKIGFLKIKNRICVAMSRAKMGFYVIGNFDFLRSKSTLWDAMVKTMEEDDQIGKSLQLYCQQHPDIVINAEKAEDFEAAPEGGCQKPCKTRLKCGHVCTRRCHPYDLEHDKFMCLKMCVRICEQGHPCKRKCYVPCKCPEIVTKLIPKCLHLQAMQCHRNPDTFNCQMTCTEELKCGHTSHYYCHEQSLKYTCEDVCQTILPCGHHCQEICGAAHTTHCNKRVEKTFPCGHTITVACEDQLSSDVCKSTCIKELPCGHLCRTACGVPCTTSCRYRVEKTFECSHTATVPCYMFDRALCPTHCWTVLACGHSCSGTCASCNEGRLHNMCKECSDCKTALICGHVWNGKAGTSSFCDETCKTKCKHVSCKQKCNLPCSSVNLPSPLTCDKECEWKCSHYVCSMKCSEMCDRPRCNEPCLTINRCKHQCSGLCGEPCPPFCSKCTSEMYGELGGQEAVAKHCKAFTFGKSITKKTQFIFLEDCSHVIELSVLDRWMNNWTGQNGGNIISYFQLPFCPLSSCKQRIHRNSRYNNIIRKAETDFDFIKKENLKTKQVDFAQQANTIIHDITGIMQDFSQLSRLKIERCTTAIDSCIIQRNTFTSQEIQDCNKEFRRIALMIRLFALKERVDVEDPRLNKTEEMLNRGSFQESMQHAVDDLLAKNNMLQLVERYNVKQLPLTTCSGVLHAGSWVNCKEGHLSLATDVGARRTCPHPQCEQTAAYPGGTVRGSSVPTVDQARSLHTIHSVRHSSEGKGTEDVSDKNTLLRKTSTLSINTSRAQRQTDISQPRNTTEDVAIHRNNRSLAGEQ